jgi:hypothetical protein
MNLFLKLAFPTFEKSLTQSVKSNEKSVSFKQGVQLKKLFSDPGKLLIYIPFIFFRTVEKLIESLN